MNPKEKKKFNFARFLIPCLIVLITAIAFSSSLKNDFIHAWDDDTYVGTNELIKDISWKGIQAIFSNHYAGNYHPLTTLSNAMEYKISALNPWIYHFNNLLIHLLNGILVYILIFRFTKKIEIAALVSIFFSIHPMHVESVAWIAERKDVLYTFFYLLSLLFYLEYIQVRKNKYYLFTLLAFTCALLSKAAAISLLPVLLLFDYYLNRTFHKKLFLEKIPFLVLSILFGIILIYTQKKSGAINDINAYHLIDRIFLVSYAFVFYIFKLIIPNNLTPTHTYPIKNGIFLPIEYYLSLLFMLAIAYKIYQEKKYKKEIIFGMLFYLFTIVMTFPIIPVGESVVSERYSYIPYIGLLFIGGTFYSELWHSARKSLLTNKVITTFILILLVVIFSVLTYQRNKDWKDGITFFTDAIEKNHDASKAYWNRGITRYVQMDIEGAVADFTEVIRINPHSTNAVAYNDRGVFRCLLQDYPNAIEDFNHAIEINPASPNVYNERGKAKFSLNDTNGALKDYSKALALDSNHADARMNRGIIYFEIGNKEKALQDLNKAIELNKTLFWAFANRAELLETLNNKKEALKDYNEAIKLNPTNADVWYKRGVLLNALSDREAIDNFNNLESINSAYPGLYDQRALAYLKDGNLSQACRDWEQAMQMGSASAPQMIAVYCNKQKP